MIKWLREKIRSWLGIKDVEPFMGVDLGWHDYTAVVLIRRTANRRDEYLEVMHFNPGTAFRTIQSEVRRIAQKYGVKENNIVQDLPRGTGVDRIRF